MRPKFLLDEHISRRVAAQQQSASALAAGLPRRVRKAHSFGAEAASRRGADVRAVDGSDLAGLDDRSLLRAAVRDGRILVTYNNGDYAPLLVDLLREGAAVPGVVFVNGETLRPSDVGGLARALAKLSDRIAAGEADASGGLFVSRG